VADVEYDDNIYIYGNNQWTTVMIVRTALPQLGGPVSFHYCRQCGITIYPAGKQSTAGGIFDIVTYFKKNLSEDQFNRLVTLKPKPKISSLIEMIEQAKTVPMTLPSYL